MAITPKTIKFGPTLPKPRKAVTQTVALKATWGEDWQDEPFLYCDAATWEVAPGESTAILYYRYGRGRRTGETKFVEVMRLDKPRYYVRVTFTPEGSDPLYWYGILEIDGDEFDGTLINTGRDDKKTGLATGRQKWMAYGLERLLDLTIVQSSTWLDQDGLKERVAGRGFTFNPESHFRTTKHQRAKTRTLKKLDNCYLFASSTDPAQTGYWSTFDIVEYLLAKQAPKDAEGSARIKFRLANGSTGVLPTWDRPELKPDHVRLRHLLNRLMPRERLLSYFLSVERDDEGEETGIVLLNPFTFTKERIVIGEDVLPRMSLGANPDQKIVVLDYDPGVQGAMVKRTTVEQVEQVVVRGARRRSCFTASYADGTIAAGWSNALKNEYITGASTGPDYPALTELDERAVRNIDARAADKFETVFARFKLPDNWNFKAADGIGGASLKPVAPDDSDVTKAYPLWPPELYLLAHLPLFKGHAYGGTITPGSIPTFAEGPYEELPPLVFVPLPEDPDRYVQIENMGKVFDSESSVTEETDHGWSGSVRVPHNDRAILVRVHGDDQHLIAGGDWTPIDSSDRPDVPFDWKNFIFTLAVEDDRFAEARYPERPEARGDVVHSISIETGDVCRLDYIVPGTVVQVNPATGELVLCDGGYLRDDRDMLRRLARLAYEWYKQRRAVLEFSTSDVKGDLWLGQLITKIGDQTIEGGHQQDVNSVVTQISLSHAGASGSSPNAPRISYVTGFGELDPLRF